MRFLLKVSMAVEAGNTLVREGTMAQTIGSIVEQIRPEATYFGLENGKRTAFLTVNIDDASKLPEVCEPFFLAANATVEAIPVMTLDDLKKAGPAIDRAGKKYGN